LRKFVILETVTVNALMGIIRGPALNPFTTMTLTCQLRLRLSGEIKLSCRLVLLWQQRQAERCRGASQLQYDTAGRASEGAIPTVLPKTCVMSRKTRNLNKSYQRMISLELHFRSRGKCVGGRGSTTAVVQSSTSGCLTHIVAHIVP
jgi:hypothetical protein